VSLKAKQSKNGKTANGLMFVAAGLFIVSLIWLAVIGWGYVSSALSYKNLGGPSGDAFPRAEHDARNGKVAASVDFAKLRTINPDIVAWISVPGTRISYPVVQGTDNHKYLKKMFDGSSGKYGSIFLDAKADKNLTDDNVIVYGHHMRDGGMFHDFATFATSAIYFKKHSVIYLETPDRLYKLDAISAYVVSGTAVLPQTFGSEEQLDGYLTRVLKRSRFARNATVPVGGITQLFTFATCSYQFDDARTVVTAIESSSWDIDRSAKIETSETK